MEYLEGVKHLFIALRAYKIFQQENKHSPKPNDYPSVLEIGNKLASKYGLTQIDERFIK